MRKFSSLVFLLLGLVAFLPLNIQAREYETVAGDPMQTRIYTLDNGLKVYLSVNKEKPRLQANIAVRTGSRNDPAETTGLAHYLEHLMFKGTKQFGVTDAAAEQPYLDDIEARYEHYRTLTDPEARRQAYHEIDSVSQLAAKYFIPNEYDKLMSAIGSNGTNAYTSFDVTCYVENIPSNEIENWAKVQADRFQNMVIRGFHTELEAVYEEYNIHLTDDSDKEINALFAKLFPTHPYGTQTTIGTQEHLKNPSITNIKNYFKRYYVPNNVAICMAGDFDPDEVIAIIEKYFGSWQRSETLSRPEYSIQPALTAIADTTVIGQEAENIMLAWRFDAGNTAQVDTLDVIADILANGKAGLFEINLEQTMKAQGVAAFCYPLTDYSTFIIQGTPKDNQSLEELRALILEEFDKLKRGEFADDLLESVINNKKLQFLNSLDDNRSRTSIMVDAFINNQKWEDVVAQLERQSKMTKQQIVEFAQRHFGNNFVCVYKREGEDTTQKKIDKPAITAIPTNRDLQSPYLADIKNAEVKAIEPQFIDFKHDLDDTVTSKGLPLLYKQNTTDDRFTLSFVYDFGDEDDLAMSYAANYTDYIGTAKKSVTEIKQEFYKLACNYHISVGDNETQVWLTGLNENLPQALALLEDLLQNAKADADSYGKYVDLIQKGREDSKKEQQNNFDALRAYGHYGPYNGWRNILTVEQLRATDPQQLVDNLKRLRNMQQTVLYYGPMSQQELSKLLAKTHKTAKKLTPVPVGQEYTQQTTPENEILIAPYDAKNIYMIQYHNENKPWNKEEAPLRAMFNEYFGGGMNTIVFQELRESRGLAYSAFARYNSPSRKNEPETFFTYIISQNDKMMDCIRTFNQIVDTIPQSQAAFDIAKQSLTKSLQSRRVTKYGVLSSYYWYKQMGLNSDPNEQTYNALPTMTLQDIVDFEQKNIAKKPYRYIILGDEKDLDMESLSKIAPIKRLTTEEIFGY
jgi:predicted Zn-dependent peptidase